MVFKGLTLQDLDRAANEDGDSGLSPSDPPPWLDMDRFRRGQEFFKKHITTVSFSMHVSLVTGFSILILLEPLVFTGNSDTPEKAFKRYIQTFYHIVLWCTEDIWDVSSRAHKSVQIVRNMHKTVGRKMNKLFSNRKYLSQRDMALVQSGFFGGVLMYPDGFGIKCTMAELEDYCYVWRCIGYLLGIKDEYNLCTGNYAQTLSIVKEIEQECLLPSLASPPTDFNKMANAYIDGINLPTGLNIHTKESVIGMSYDGMGLPVPKMGIFDWLRMYWMKFFIFLMRWLPGFRNMMNRRTRGAINVLMAKYFGSKADTYMDNYHNL